MPTVTHSQAVRYALSIAALSVAAGCGHPASLEECEAIFTRSAAVELGTQKVTDEKKIATRTAGAREKAESVIQACVGRRITDGALDCMRAAKTSDDIDRCLD